MGETFSGAHIFLALSWALALAWVWQALAALRGLARLPDLTRIDPASLPALPAGDGPHLTVVVPARNEEAGIEAALRSLLASTAIRLQIVAVDDRSTDRSGERMDAIAESDAALGPHTLQVLHLTELPPGWLGKPHALAQGVKESVAPWLLFTDGDVVFQPRALELALREAIALKADHMIVVPTIVLKTLAERAMLATMQVLGQWTVRLWKVSDPAARDFVGVGAFNLVRREVYEKIGGFEALRMEVVEDLYLGQRVKKFGFAQRAVVGPGLVSVRWIDGALGVPRLMEKNGFAIFRFRVWLTALACFGLMLDATVPLAAMMCGGWFTAAGVLTYAAIGLLYFANWRFSRVSPWHVLLFGPAAAYLAYGFMRSMILALARNGVEWRGTRYSLPELRRSVATLK